MEKAFKFDTIFVAYISILGYFLSYLYQLGLFKYYNIPTDFIIIDLTTILFSIVTIGTLLVLPMLLLQSFSILGFFHGKTQTSILITRVAFIIVYLYSLTIVKGLDTFMIGMFVVSGLLIFLELFLPYVTQKDKIGFEAKLAAHTHTELEERKNDIVYSELSKNRPFIYLMLTSVFFCQLAYGMGEKEARGREWFMVSTNYTNTVILKSYNNYYIASEYDPVSRKLLNKYSLVRNENNLDFRIENLKGLSWK